ncbi:MAG: PAS domain S-box protein [Spirochaetaceae bacterium]|nr:PAS domain S-box protein [Spirochaetaceae bacterium]MCF7947425.1 PAS domain S-box protein [Spirochaetia bacterium]MCF7951508.1 PAS domain S-box protein [Spirochaetaceae bacterium]
MDKINVILVTEDNYLENAINEQCRQCTNLEPLVVHHNIASIEWEDIGEYRAFIIDLPSLSSDPMEILGQIDGEAVVLLTDFKRNKLVEEIIGKYELQLLVKDPQNGYLQMVSMFIRKALKVKDKENSTMEVIHHIHKRKYDFLNAVPDIVYQLDSQGNFVYLNDAVRTMGYTPEELLGRHFSTIVVEEDRQKAARSSVLPKYSGKVTGYEGSPGLFDERRSRERATRELEVKLKKRVRGNEVDKATLGSIIAYGEVTATGQYTRENKKRTFIGTVGIIRDITTRRKSEKLLHLLSFALEQNPSGICIIDAEKKIVYVNPYFSNKFDVPYDMVNTLSVDGVWKKIFGKSGFNEVVEEIEENGFWHQDLRIDAPRGLAEWYSVMLYPVAFFNDATHYVLILVDITEKKSSEVRLKKELDEKDILLKEIHHRVKNNLNIISSLFNLQMNDSSQNEELNGILLASQNRIHTMARVHEQLYNEDSFSYINISTYISSLVPEILNAYGSVSHIKLKIDVDEVHLPLTQAIPCGLIINELITNAYQHAFPNKQAGKITVSLELDDKQKCVLKVHDNGVGLPHNFIPQQSETLGMQLIHGLCEQLNGKIEFLQESGTIAKLVLSDPNLRG